MFQKLKKSISLLAVAVLLMFSLGSLGVLAGNSVQAAACSGLDCAKSGASGSKGSLGGDLVGTIQTVVNILLFLVGAVSVIVLIVAGFRFVTANGDTGTVTQAKNSIIYAIIGIVVAFSAYAISSFITGQLKESAKTPIDCSHKSADEKKDIAASDDKRCE